MNGLKFIRTQCNISISSLADSLGVSRQLVSAWETGKKQISEKRLKQLSSFFGVSDSFFCSINDEQKKVIMGKPMFRYGKGEDEFYLYRDDYTCAESIDNVLIFSLQERDILLSDEYKEKKSEQRRIVEKINGQIGGPQDMSLRNQMISINRGTEYYELCYKNMEAAFSKPNIERMFYYHRLLEVMKAISNVFGVDYTVKGETGDFTYADDPDFIEELASVISRHMEPKCNYFQAVEARRKKGKTVEDERSDINGDLKEAIPTDAVERCILMKK